MVLTLWIQLFVINRTSVRTGRYVRFVLIVIQYHDMSPYSAYVGFARAGPRYHLRFVQTFTGISEIKYKSGTDIQFTIGPNFYKLLRNIVCFCRNPTKPVYVFPGNNKPTLRFFVGSIQIPIVKQQKNV